MKKTAAKPNKFIPRRHRNSVQIESGVEPQSKDMGTVRKCIVTGNVLPIDKLIRFGIAPDGTVCPDLPQKLPGRGIWITADKDAVQAAVTKGLFKKAGRCKVACPDNLVEMIDSLFSKRVQNLLGFARKAGQVVTGFEKVEALLMKQRAAYVLEAADGAADGRGKITRLCVDIPVFDLLTSAEMAESLGTGICVHAALITGGASDLLAAEMKRWAAFRHTEF